MKCNLFNCDKMHRHQCCALCERRSSCDNPCLNHPDRCGQLREETPKETAAAAGIRFITKTTAKLILDSGFESGKYKPIGRFIFRDKKKFIGIDNSTGHAWTEEFDSKTDCLKWLAGEMPREEAGG